MSVRTESEARAGLTQRTTSTLALTIGLMSCANAIAAPSAFTEERYLCDATGFPEFDRSIADCRARAGDQQCLGFVSLQGTIDGQPIVIDSPVTKVRVDEETQTSGAKTEGLTVWARSPYFDFRLAFVDRVVPANGAVQGMPVFTSTSDYINVEARGGNYFATWTNETRDVQRVTAEEVRFTFSTDLLRGGHLDGCLDVFPSALP